VPGVLVALPAALVIAERDEPAALASGPRTRLVSLLGGMRAIEPRRRAARTTRRAGSGHEPA